ncbi:unnamed protein product [Alternaria alternata]
MELPTLAAIQEIPDTPPLEKSDHFALTIFMVSTLGHIARWAFRQGASETRLPWDSRSEFSRINGMLLSFESYSDACDGNFVDILDKHFVFQGFIDEGLVFFITLFFYGSIYRHLRRMYPLGFFEMLCLRAWNTHHAWQPFYTPFKSVVDDALANDEKSRLLRDFQPTSELARILLSYTLDRAPLVPEFEELLWHMCDYSWLVSSNRPTSNTAEERQSASDSPDVVTTLNATSGDTTDFETLLQGVLSLDYSRLGNIA